MAKGKGRLRPGLLLLVVLGPIAVAMHLFQVTGFDPATLPDHGPWMPLAVPLHNNRVLRAAEKLGNGLLPGPEDLAYDFEAQVLYTGCSDGWIKKVWVEPSGNVSVENWVYVDGGRPLGLALGPDNQLIVADAYKGLLRVTREGTVEVLTDEAEGVRFRLTDGVDVAGDGIIYFTDASYKYDIGEVIWDALEGRPYGRLMSFNPSRNETRVLVRDLYFANGVALSPEHDFLIFCETILGRCRKYHIQGDKRGSVDNFLDNLPGFPDNVKYDGEGRFWVALVVGRTYISDWLMKSRFIRKVSAIFGSLSWIPGMNENGGMLAVGLNGDVQALYSDPGLYSVSSGMKIGSHLFYGSLYRDHISRLDLTEHAPHVS